MWVDGGAGVFVYDECLFVCLWAGACVCEPLRMSVLCVVCLDVSVSDGVRCPLACSHETRVLFRFSRSFAVTRTSRLPLASQEALARVHACMHACLPLFPFIPCSLVGCLSLCTREQTHTQRIPLRIAKSILHFV